MTRRDLRTAERDYRATNNRTSARRAPAPSRPRTFNALAMLAHLATAVALIVTLSYILK